MDSLKIDTGQGVDVHLQIAGLGARSYAFIIDWHIRFLLALAWFALVLLFVDISNSLFENFKYFSDGGDSTLVLFAVLPPMIIYFLYHPILEIVMQGRTPGKRIANIQILKEDGRIPSIGTHLIRNVFRLIDSLPGLYCIGIIVALNNKRHLRIGDLAAGTIEVYNYRDSEQSFDDIDFSIKNKNISIEHLQTLRELVQRWRELEANVRRPLAIKVLSIVASDERLDEDSSDKEILARLKKVLANE